MWNAKLGEAQARIKTARRNISNLRYADDTTLMVESEEELKSLLMKVKEEREKVGLKSQYSENWDHGTQFHHFMANRWETIETVRDVIFGGLQTLQMVTVAMKLKDACSLEEKLWEKIVSEWKSLSCVWLFTTPWT